MIAFAKNGPQRRQMPERPSPKRRRHRRILVIEDDDSRVADFKSWLPDDVRIVHARSAGQALGLLRRAEPGNYVGLMLDHDLVMQPRTAEDGNLSGSDVVTHLIQHSRKWASLPVLVHSMNPAMSIAVTRRLDTAGFVVERIPFTDLSGGQLVAWYREALEDWLEDE